MSKTPIHQDFPWKRELNIQASFKVSETQLHHLQFARTAYLE